MLARVSSSELAEWAAYERVHGPLGPSRGDVLHAVHMALVYNQWAEKGKTKKPKDFLPEWDQRSETEEQQIARGRMWVQMMGGDVDG